MMFTANQNPPQTALENELIRAKIMNCQRLLTILVACMLLSACAYKIHRTQTLASPPTEPQHMVSKCAVDTAAKSNEGLSLCEKSDNPNFSESPESHAIQHRFYVGCMDVEDCSGNLSQGDYYLSFVEFDDQGWFADRRQMEALFALLDDLEVKNKKTLIYVYAHGWKHNASACDNNVVCFSRLLERYDLAERFLRDEDHTTQRKVIGVYLGWQGLPFDGFLNNLSFWTRKNAAARVGRGGVFELLTRLKDYQDNQDIRQKQEEETDTQKSQLVITGHSFGGLVIYEALSHALMERAAKTKPTKPDDSNNATQYEAAESFGDFVMLVNPAFEGSLYEPLFHIATNRCYATDQRPVMMIVTSDADGATKTAFPIGRSFSTLFEHKRSSEQGKSMRQTIGHNDRYVTHNLGLTSNNEEKQPSKKEVPKEKDCGCPHLESTSGWDAASVWDLFDGVVGNDYGNGVELKGVVIKKDEPKYASNYPYLVVKTDENLIADHNAIYSERFTTFSQVFVIKHIVRPKPVPLPGDEPCRRDEEAYPQRTKGGLLPDEQSCWLDDDGTSCSVPKKMEER
jgi:hypothetical protein